jgi:hypothetical protein
MVARATPSASMVPMSLSPRLGDDWAWLGSLFDEFTVTVIGTPGHTARGTLAEPAGKPHAVS